jgi:hypothetical protein
VEIVKLNKKPVCFACIASHIGLTAIEQRSGEASESRAKKG